MTLTNVIKNNILPMVQNTATTESKMNVDFLISIFDGLIDVFDY